MSSSSSPERLGNLETRLKKLEGRMDNEAEEDKELFELVARSNGSPSRTEQMCGFLMSSLKNIWLCTGVLLIIAVIVAFGA